MSDLVHNTEIEVFEIWENGKVKHVLHYEEIDYMNCKVNEYFEEMRRTYAERFTK